MGSCSGSCAKPLPSPPPHYFTLVKGWSEGEGRVAAVERGGTCGGVKGGVSHYDSAATAGPTSNPLTWGHLPALLCPTDSVALSESETRFRPSYQRFRRSRMLPRARCLFREGLIPRFGAFPLPSVSVRVRAPTAAAANSSNGRRRQTTCGKSFSNRREREREAEAERSRTSRRHVR